MPFPAAMHRGARFHQPLRAAVHVPRVGSGDHGRDGLVGRKHRALLLQDVLAVVRQARQLDVHRPGPPAARDVERLRHHLRDVLDALDARAPLGDVLEHLVDEGGIVHAVKGLEVGLQRHRAADVHHRRGRAVGLRHARHGVEAARPGGDDAHPGLAGEAAVGVRHERDVRLLLAGDEADRLHPGEPVVDRVDVGAGNAVDPLDAFFAQGLGHRLARVHCHALHSHEAFSMGK